MTDMVSDNVSDLLDIILDMETREDIPATVTDPTDDILKICAEVPHAKAGQPYVKIVEEPACNLYRFRYKSEGGTAGAIPGERQQGGKKSFPKIMLCNYSGWAWLEVTCLMEDLRVHPNTLVCSQSKRQSPELVKAGIYRTKIQGDMEEEIKVGVNLAKKAEVLHLLCNKQELGVDPYRKGYSHAEEMARKQIDLTSIQICFSVSIQHQDGSWVALPPAVTRVVHHNMDRAELNIRDISDTKSHSAGGEKKILICDKFDPSGLQIVFHDELSGFGEFSPGDIHNKSCVVFTTPAYPSLEQDTTVNMLMSKLDGSGVSNTIYFTYYSTTETGQKDMTRTKKHQDQTQARRRSTTEPEGRQTSSVESSGSFQPRWSNYTYQHISGNQQH